MVKNPYSPRARSGLPQNFRAFMSAALAPVEIEKQEAPVWPFASISVEQWEGLPYRVRHQMEAAVKEFLGATRG